MCDRCGLLMMCEKCGKEHDKIDRALKRIGK